MTIPPKFHGHVHHQAKENSVRQKVKDLEVGEYVILPLNKRNQVGFVGNSLGMKFATRQMGEKDTFRCYRTA